jgi:hypothetical protein
MVERPHRDRRHDSARNITIAAGGGIFDTNESIHRPPASHRRLDLIKRARERQPISPTDTRDLRPGSRHAPDWQRRHGGSIVGDVLDNANLTFNRHRPE